MADAKRHASGGDNLNGAGMWRRWTDREKARIVAEALSGGMSVSQVARRHELYPQQVYGWIRAAKDKHGEGPPFVPVVMSGPQGAAGVEIELAGAIVRVGRDADAHVLEEVLRAVRASA